MPHSELIPADPDEEAGLLVERRIDETPVTVLDLHSTGFPAGRHRIVEMALCRVDPGERPRLVFETLIDPDRPLGGVEIHGLREEDLAGAPRFGEVAAEIVDHLAGSVVASWNMAFDVDFLVAELRGVGVPVLPPRLCLMFLRSMLGLGERCALEEACRRHGVEHDPSGGARSEAEAASDLWVMLREETARQGISTFGDLARLGSYPFLASFSAPMLGSAESFGLERGGRPKRRVVHAFAGQGGRKAVRRYWNAVSAALADLEISDIEAGLVRAMRELLRLPEEEMRAVHARAFVQTVSMFAGDDWLDGEECERIRQAREGLAKLGWAPGD